MEGKNQTRELAIKGAGEEIFTAFGTSSLQPGSFLIFKYLHFKILCPGHIPSMSAAQCFHIDNRQIFLPSIRLYYPPVHVIILDAVEPPTKADILRLERLNEMSGRQPERPTKRGPIEGLRLMLSLIQLFGSRACRSNGMHRYYSMPGRTSPAPGRITLQ